MNTLASRFWTRVRVLARQPTWWAEVSVAASLTLWAMISIHNTTALNHNHSFSLLLKLAPQHVWELWALSAGLFHILALLINGTRWFSDGRHWRIAASMASAWFLTFVLINFFCLPTVPPGTAMYLVPLAVDLLALFKNVRRTA